jgi:hypothetical protein
MNTLLALVAFLSLTAPPSVPAPPVASLDVAAVEALLDSPIAANRLLGAKRLLARAKAHPNDFVALEGGARALFLRSTWETDRTRAAALAKRCWKAADKLVAEFPSMAQGHYWGALCIGQYAKNSDVSAAIVQGLPAKMEASAHASIARQPELYAMGAQRLLGCYFARAPWPIGNFAKALDYLVLARAADPTDANGLLCLAETLKARGNPTEAHAVLVICAGLHTRDTATIAICAERLAE